MNTGKTYADWQQRVIDERAARAGELERLNAFILTPAFSGLDEAEKTRMSRQSAVMSELVAVLDERIAAF